MLAALRSARSARASSLRFAILFALDQQPLKISDKKKGPNFSEPLFLIRANRWPWDIHPRSPICDQRDLFRARSNFSIHAEIWEFVARLSDSRRSWIARIPFVIFWRLCSARRSINSRSICIVLNPFAGFSMISPYPGNPNKLLSPEFSTLHCKLSHPGTHCLDYVTRRNIYRAKGGPNVKIGRPGGHLRARGRWTGHSAGARYR